MQSPYDLEMDRGLSDRKRPRPIADVIRPATDAGREALDTASNVASDVFSRLFDSADQPDEPEPAVVEEVPAATRPKAPPPPPPSRPAAPPTPKARTAPPSSDATTIITMYRKLSEDEKRRVARQLSGSGGGATAGGLFSSRYMVYAGLLVIGYIIYSSSREFDKPQKK